MKTPKFHCSRTAAKYVFHKGLTKAAFPLFAVGIFVTSTNSFLFSLKNDLNKPFKSEIYRKPEEAIYDFANYGPTFGRHDLVLSNRCHASHPVSYTNLGANYKPPFGYEFESKEAQEIMPGSFSFVCSDYEVFYQA